MQALLKQLKPFIETQITMLKLGQDHIVIEFHSYQWLPSTNNI